MKKNKFLITIAALLIFTVGYFAFFNNTGEAETPNPENESKAIVDSIARANTQESNQEAEMRRLELMAEHTRPDEFIQIVIDPKKNVLGESVLEGMLTNKSKHTAYEEIELMIYWNDEKGMVLDSAVEVIFASIQPGASSEFKTKRKGPRKGKSILVSLRDAKVIEQK